MNTKYLFASVMMLAVSAFANDCAFELRSTDIMTFIDMQGNSVPSITVPNSCEDFTISHVGKMPRTTMGHNNVVISKTGDIKEIIKDGLRYGSIVTDYIKPDDKRVIAKSGVIGKGEATSVRFSVAQIKDDDYSFFCSFAGHDRKMRDKLIVAE